MKSKFFFPSLLVVALTSCGGTSVSSSEKSIPSIPSDPELTVACPAGAPAVALAPFANSKKVEINANPANVVAYLTENSGKDVVVCPTNAGIAAIMAKNAPYRLASTVTMGNFFLASTGHDANETLDPDDYVVVFQKGNVPDKLFQYVYGDMNLTNVHYVDAVTNAAQALITVKNISDNNAFVDYVLIAEPALSAACLKNPNAKQYANLQAEYQKKSGEKVVQASIFVHKDVDVAKANTFLGQVSEFTNGFLQDPSILDSFLGDMDESTVQSKFAINADALKRMTEGGNRMGLAYLPAKENKAAIENFMKLFGMNKVDEKVYF
ncbi:MAG: hypothetical protein IJU64_06800 [Bacilli bacterium]|nr:hypothetical protein [Bacilli bacterium]